MINLIWSGLRKGLVCSMIAAAPETTPVAMLVPESSI